MERLGNYLRSEADRLAREIVDEWAELGEQEPWHRVPANLDEDHLPDLVRAVAEVALLTLFGREQRRKLAGIAVAHGEHRRQQGTAEETIGREHEMLRWSLWRRLKSQASIEEASQAIIRIDSALSFAHGASLRGFHRAYIEQSGDWPRAVDDYINEWVFPDARDRSRQEGGPAAS